LVAVTADLLCQSHPIRTKLVKHAKAKNLEGATIVYFKLTTTTGVQRHKYVRDLDK
jgi:hypothetical protein